MAYKGGIDHLQPPFGTVDWNTAGIRVEWSMKELNAIASGFRMGETGTWDFDITWDIPGLVDSKKTILKCVIVGVSMKTGAPAAERMHFVLVIALREKGPESPAKDREIYERVGVGSMLGKYIDLDGMDDSQSESWVKIL